MGETYRVVLMRLLLSPSADSSGRWTNTGGGTWWGQTGREGGSTCGFSGGTAIQVFWSTNRQTDMEAGRQADRQTDSQTSRQASWQADRPAGTQANRKTDIHCVRMWCNLVVASLFCILLKLFKSMNFIITTPTHNTTRLETNHTELRLYKMA